MKRLTIRIARISAAALITAGSLAVPAIPAALGISPGADPHPYAVSAHAAAPALQNTDPDLDQQLEADEQLGSGQVVIADGHVDFGPTVGLGAPLLLIHDDSVDTPLWRKPADVVLRVTDAAKMPVPQEVGYEFIGVPAGTEVWVLPQTQQPGTVWPGWNTQEPALIAALQGGTQMRIKDVRGPGEVSVYLQSGNFSAPDLLWSTSSQQLDPVWVENNSHVHANWIFTAPGAYGIDIEFELPLAGGAVEKAAGTLQFAVGDNTDVQSAFAMSNNSQGTNVSQESPAEHSENSLATLLYLLCGIILTAIIGAVVILTLASKKAKKRALQQLQKNTHAGEESTNEGAR